MRMEQKGILTGLGTDGYTHDMMESWKVANVLHKHSLCDPNAAWGEVPQMLFEGNAKIANRYFKKQLGVLKEGAAADVIVIDYDPLTPMNESNINGHLMFGVNGSMVQSTRPSPPPQARPARQVPSASASPFRRTSSSA